ncbi:MAG TPA: hypothetical protein VHL09_02565 [Dehalococcoidia bacterium]|nr:hypothetical protein [Dehalococcoidia bacterium]
MRILWRALMSIALVTVGFLPALGIPSATAAAAATDRPATGASSGPAAPAYEVIRGFTVSDEGGIPFYQTYLTFGTDVVGYPISQRFTWDGFTVQAFQKVIMQWQPGDQRVDFLNIVDLMGDAGHDPYLEVVRSTPPRLSPEFDAGLTTYQEIEARRLTLLNESPEIAAVYWASPSPILQYGLPTSHVTHNGNHLVMRFQRVIMQLWLEAVPWAEPGMVTIANGADISKELGMLPQEALVPDNGAAGGLPPLLPIDGGQPGNLQPLPGGGGVPSGWLAYGMQIDPGTDMGRALGMLRAAGFGWAKVQIRWEDLEGSPGAINWGFIDNVVNTIAAAGVKPQLTIVTAPAWSRPAGDDRSVPGPPANYADYANFASALAARHRGKIGAIEMWNEENLYFEWGGRGRVNAAEYVRMACTAYPAIKNADPNVIVISGAMTPTGVNEGGIAVDDLVYLEQMYQAGIKDCSDAIGAHPGGFNNPPDDDPSTNSRGLQEFKGHWSFYFRRFEQYRDVMVRYGDEGKQIWFTEFGWASSQNPYPDYAYAAQNSEQDQANFIVRAFQIARERGYVGGMMLWNLNFAPSAEPNDRWAKEAFSIIRRDWSPRPAYHAVASMPK